MTIPSKFAADFHKTNRTMASTQRVQRRGHSNGWLLTAIIILLTIHPTHANIFQMFQRFRCLMSFRPEARTSCFSALLSELTQCPTPADGTFCTTEYIPVTCNNGSSCQYSNPCSAIQAGFDIDLNCTSSKRGLRHL
jgi:hypothetical protein